MIDNSKVVTLSLNRIDVGGKGAGALEVYGGSRLNKTRSTFLFWPIEVPIGCESQLADTGDKGLRSRTPTVLGQVHHRHWAALATVFRCRAEVIFGLLKVRQDIVESPSLVSSVIPGIKIEAMSANEDAPVDGAPPTGHLALQHRHFSAIETGLLQRRKAPVKLRLLPDGK